jgi:hypothetical protein
MTELTGWAESCDSVHMQISRLIVIAASAAIAACSTAERQVAEPTVVTTTSSQALPTGVPGDDFFANCPQGFGDQPPECGVR